jgi:GDP-L-fucose synthase
MDPRVEYIQCDLTKREDCDKVVKDMRYVMIFAANTSGAAVMHNSPLVHVTPNILINSQLLEAAYLGGTEKVMWLSSTAAYPFTGPDIITEDMMFDGDPFDKYYCVGWMKRYTEVLCRMFSEKLSRKMPCIVLRPANVFGPYDKFSPQTSHVMAALLRKTVERRNPFEVWGDGNDVKDFIYIDDVVDAIMIAMEKMDHFEPLNIGRGETYSIKDILQIIWDVDNFCPEVVFNSSKPSMIPIRVCSVEKSKTVLGFSPKIDIPTGIRTTLKWYRENKDRITR